MDTAVTSIFDTIEIERSPPGSDPAWTIARRYRAAHGDGVHKPAVVWLGGFASDMSGAKATRVDQWARDAGRACLRFDYSGHGESGGDFEDGCISDWLEQSAGVIEASLPHGPLILIGSSMGAWIALLLARRFAEQGLRRPLAGLLLLAPAPDFTERLIWDELDDAARGEILEHGVWRRPSAYSETGAPITRRLIEDGRKHLVLGGTVRVHAPVQILQGSADEDVPWRYALSLVDRLAADPVSFTLIPGGDHRLSRDEDLLRMTDALERFDALSSR